MSSPNYIYNVVGVLGTGATVVFSGAAVEIDDNNIRLYTQGGVNN